MGNTVQVSKIVAMCGCRAGIDLSQSVTPGGGDALPHRRAPRWRALVCAAVTLWLAVGTAGCSALKILSAASPDDHYTRHTDLPYGDAPRQRLDVYVPESVSAPAPLVVFFYGGGWKSGSKDKYEFVASSLTNAGFVVVLPDYRLHPQVSFPVFVQDAARAVAWARDAATRYGADPDGIYLMGHSAGAHIAALLATDERWLGETGVGRASVAGLLGLSGPYDFLPIESGYLLEVFPEPRGTSQPIRHVDAGVPPTLLIHGRDDKVVEPGNSERFAQALREAGVSVRTEFYDDTGHRRVAAALAPPLDFLSGTLEDCIAFIRERERARD